MVDNEVLNILRQRKEDCVMYEGADSKAKCGKLIEEYDKAAENWFIKCKFYLWILLTKLDDSG